MVSKHFRATAVIATNIILGWSILRIHGVQELVMPFTAIAIGILLLALMALQAPHIVAKALFSSLLVAVLVPIAGLWITKASQGSPESVLVIGLLAIGMAWKECLLMFLANFGLFLWYSKSKDCCKQTSNH